MQPVTYFPFLAHTYPSPILESCEDFLEHTFGAVALQTGTRHVLRCSFSPDVCMSLVQPLPILPPGHCSGSAVTR